MEADYQFLTVDEVPEYLASVPELAARIDAEHLASVGEIGDGNLNLVFLAKDVDGRGVVVKQALPYVRMVGEGWPMTPEREKHEIQSLLSHHALVPDLVVEVLHHDEQRHIIGMEDLSDHRVWRHALNEGATHDGAAEAVGTYIGAVAFGTSVFGMGRQELADAQAAAINPELCEITEDLVFTEPSVDAGRNAVLPENEPDAAALAADDTFVDAMGWAKYAFMTHGEALIHGDLHTGSVMVRSPEGSTRADSVKVFDSEFAFYGPVAFDMGATWANYVLAAARAFAMGDDERGSWALSLVDQTWQGFESEFRKRWPERRDARVWRDSFLESRIADWQAESWLFAAAKMSRRIVGAAKVTDVQTLPEELRVGAARGVLAAARAVVRRDGDVSAAVFAGRCGDELLRHRG
ncbi:S-methyl-5-thioribose kinase [Actinotalea sp. M2MS4P-6]|uniref:S-methyl-5-thioribose kinase n=1 Tax=Actinotalea sp. M2MS4P-6 TaxID=2983762 RepID=UPI0021E4C9B2|nr:S-methyl-5-thioribose kinase [Actinotalea sp. M2MS4P-6]MCV2393061.1 S-methyl-5-thioribose kinase [Actinotalea sp. M2MS4P-6]